MKKYQLSADSDHKFYNSKHFNSKHFKTIQFGQNNTIIYIYRY